jgi:hypothetical protein
VNDIPNQQNKMKTKSKLSIRLSASDLTRTQLKKELKRRSLSFGASSTRLQLAAILDRALSREQADDHESTPVIATSHIDPETAISHPDTMMEQSTGDLQIPEVWNTGGASTRPDCSSPRQCHALTSQEELQAKNLQLQAQLTSMRREHQAATSSAQAQTTATSGVQEPSVGCETGPTRQHIQVPVPTTSYSLQTAMGTPLSGPMPFPQFSGETRGAVPSGMYSSGTDLINPMGLNTSIVNSSYNHFGGVISNQLGVPSDSLPEIDVVSPTLRRDIILGKDINMSYSSLGINQNKYHVRIS